MQKRMTLQVRPTLSARTAPDWASVLSPRMPSGRRGATRSRFLPSAICIWSSWHFRDTQTLPPLPDSPAGRPERTAERPSRFANLPTPSPPVLSTGRSVLVFSSPCPCRCVFPPPWACAGPFPNPPPFPSTRRYRCFSRKAAKHGRQSRGSAVQPIDSLSLPPPGRALLPCNGCNNPRPLLPAGLLLFPIEAEAAEALGNLKERAGRQLLGWQTGWSSVSDWHRPIPLLPSPPSPFPTPPRSCVPVIPFAGPSLRGRLPRTAFRLCVPRRAGTPTPTYTTYPVPSRRDLAG